MLNESTNAQALIPMAVSLGFGIIFATFITLLITPVMYMAGHRFKYGCIGLLKRLHRYWNKGNAVA